MSSKNALFPHLFRILMPVLVSLVLVYACNEEELEDKGPPIYPGIDGDDTYIQTDGDEDNGFLIPPADGDRIVSDADFDPIVADGDGEEFELPDGIYCQSEVYCPPGTHCDPVRHICLSECNPVYPD